MVRVIDEESLLTLDIKNADDSKPLLCTAVLKAFKKKFRTKFNGNQCTKNCLSSIDGRRMLDGDISKIKEVLLTKRFSEAVTIRGRRKKETKLQCIAYIGGSITAQRQGWRPQLHTKLEDQAGHPIEAIDISCGNAGSTLLAFTLRERIKACKKNIDLVFLEVAINDGDVLLEARHGAATEVRQALEGIVRELALVPIIMIEMFLRDDLASNQRSGTQAWVHTEDVKATAQIYSHDVVSLHADIAAHYPWCSQIDLNKIFLSLNSSQRDLLFRDDCHHTPQGAAFVANAIFAALNDNTFWLPLLDYQSIPNPIDPQFRRPQCAKRFEFNDIVHGPVIAPRTLRGDRCPLTGNPATWIWLHPGDAIDCRFSGRGLAIVTCVGPDSGQIKIIELKQQLDDHFTIIDLADKWCYYWRTTIIRLWTGPYGDHHIRIEPCPSLPPSSRYKKPVIDPRFLQDLPPGLGKAPKLWLMWLCIYN